MDWLSSFSRRNDVPLPHSDADDNNDNIDMKRRRERNENSTSIYIATCYCWERIWNWCQQLRHSTTGNITGAADILQSVIELNEREWTWERERERESKFTGQWWDIASGSFSQLRSRLRSGFGPFFRPRSIVSVSPSPWHYCCFWYTLMG